MESESESITNDSTTGKTEKNAESVREEVQSNAKPRFSDPTMDPDWLYHTLRKEISKEATYNLENDAKIRAITQGTVDYEQFRQMVLGAHIRPLQKADKVEGCQNGKRPYVVWNTAAKKNQNE